MKRRMLVPLAAVLLGALVVTVGLESAPRFTGLRWDPGVPAAPRRPPQVGSTQTGAPPQPSHQVHAAATPIDLFPFVMAAALIVAVVIALLIVRWYRRRAPMSAEGHGGDAAASAAETAPEPHSEQPNAPVLRRAFADALDALETSRTPRDAIVAAWLALQDAAGRSGIRRRPAETPTEFTARILQRVAADRKAVETLLIVYQEVRFGAHTPTAADVARVRNSLLTLSASWDDLLSPASRTP